MIFDSNLIKRVKSSVAFYPWLHFGSVVILSSTMTIIFSLFLFMSNLENILISWGSQLEMNIYLSDNLSNDQTQDLEKKIHETNQFKELKYVAKEKAIEGFFSKMSKYVPDFAEDKDFLKVIPSSYLGTLSQGLSLNEISKLAKKIMTISGVEDVSYGQEWIQNFSTFLSTLRKTSLFISLVLAFGGVFIIGFVSYILIHKRKEEIEIYELCGATSQMIQAPHILEGFLLSTVSGVIAICSSYFILILQNDYLHKEMLYLGLNQTFHFYSLTHVFIIVFVSGLVGALSSLLFIKKLNTGWAAAGRV